MSRRVSTKSDEDDAVLYEVRDARRRGHHPQPARTAERLGRRTISSGFYALLDRAEADPDSRG